jgi:hypothetical protein
VLVAALLAELRKRVAAGDSGDAREYEMYPRALRSPYRERRFATAAQWYAALGIRREDRETPHQAVLANWDSVYRATVAEVVSRRLN